jgi:transposase
MTTLSDQIIQLYSEGKSYNQIKDALGCSKGTISYHLGEGQKTKTRNRTQDKRDVIKRYIQEYKQGKKCTDCREEYPYFVLDFDHLADKSFNVSKHRLHTTSLDVIKAEIEKCEIVCANCHRMRTFARLGNESGNSMDITDYYIA